MSVPIAVNAGFGWTPILLVVANLLLGGGLIASWIRSRPQMKGIEQKREANLLEERATEMNSMRERLSEIEDLLRITSEELRVVRHDLANANHSLDMFIALIEANPERAAEHAARVKTMRESVRAQLAEEKAVVTKARIATIGGKK